MTATAKPKNLHKLFAMQWAAKFCGAHPAVMAVLIELTNDGEAWASVAFIAEVLDVQPRTVQRCLRTFEKEGALKTQFGGGSDTNTYRLAFEKFSRAPLKKKIQEVAQWRAESRANSGEERQQPLTKLSPPPPDKFVATPRQICHPTPDKFVTQTLLTEPSLLNPSVASATATGSVEPVARSLSDQLKWGEAQTADASLCREGYRLAEKEHEDAAAPEAADRSSPCETTKCIEEALASPPRKRSPSSQRSLDARQLRYVEKWIASGVTFDVLEKHLPWLDGVADSYDAGSGDRIGGWARRLHDDVEAMRPRRRRAERHDAELGERPARS